jgi:hypothetical protein
MAVGSGTAEAERHIIGSGREERDIGEQFFGPRSSCLVGGNNTGFTG